MSHKPVLITGGCGFVGRHLVKQLFERKTKEIWIIDDLSTGISLEVWLGDTWREQEDKHNRVFVSDETKLIFIESNVLGFLHNQVLKKDVDLLPDFGDVFHLASIVGGRSLIEGDPILVASDLGIDAVFFLWITRFPHKVERILYASSSAAYPIHFQEEGVVQALSETLIDFSSDTVGIPDFTYGWSKLTGEFLARIAHKHYGLSIACVRPFSGYGEDQDLTYPVPSIALRVARGDNPIEVWGTGTQGRDFVYIDDCVSAFFSIMETVRDGSGINIGSGKLTSFLELIETFLDIENSRAEIKPLLDKPVGVQSRYADTTYLNDTIKWQPATPLREGLTRVLNGAHERLDGNELPFTLSSI